jgi:hypothetical protein
MVVVSGDGGKVLFERVLSGDLEVAADLVRVGTVQPWGSGVCGIGYPFGLVVGPGCAATYPAGDRRGRVVARPWEDVKASAFCGFVGVCTF